MKAFSFSLRPMLRAMASPLLPRLNTCFRTSSTRLAGHGLRELPQTVTTARPYALVRDLKTFSTRKPTTFSSFTKPRRRPLSFLLATTGVGLGLASLTTTPTVHCDGGSSYWCVLPFLTPSKQYPLHSLNQNLFYLHRRSLL